MSYEVLARKWRPQQFDHVVGQQHVTRTLSNAITSERLAHAYLFVGPRGIGKTSIARIFAKAMNCVEGPTVTPCDRCDSCKEIMTSTNLDVLEIDGASNNGVEQVRDLRDTVKYAPTRGPHKIYIIDEVHMLSVAAFNALLKTLEEPPSHVKFIFATTEPEKILATILSRCQRFDLRRISVGDIVGRLKEIATAESVTISDDALIAVARGSEGGLRDAESALDQLISFRGDTIAEDDVLSVFGLVSRRTLEGLARQVLDADIKGLVQTIADLDEAGKDLQRLVLELIDHFRNLLICLHVDLKSGELDLMAEQLATLTEQAGLTTAGRVMRICEILAETEDRMRFALSRRTLLETALIRCARAASVVTLEEIFEKLNALGAGGAVDIKKKIAAKPTPPEAPVSAPATAPAPTPPVPAPAPVSVNCGDDLQGLIEAWRDIVEKVGKIAVHAKAPLLDARPVGVTAEQVVIGFDPEFSEEIEQFHVQRNRMAVEHVLSARLKRKVTAAFVVDESAEVVTLEARPAEHEAPAEAVPDVEMSIEEEQKPRRPRQAWLQEPAVKKVVETFGAVILDVRE